MAKICLSVLHSSSIWVSRAPKISIVVYVCTESFSLSLSALCYCPLALVETTVTGDATLNLVRFQDTEFGDFDVDIKPGGAALAVAEFVEGAVAAIADTLVKVAEGVVEAVKVIGESIMAIVDSLDFIAEAWDDFRDGINALFSGDPAAAAKALGQAFTAAFDPENWGEF